MRVLLLTHVFLPGHAAGTELYTLQLGRGLSARGHHVSVFTTEKDIGARDLGLRQRTVEGLPVTELINNLFHPDFRHTFDHPEIARRFGEHLDALRPDILHVQHLMYLSIGCLEEAARRGIPIVFTLHDFWLQCARFGQRLHADGGLCATIDHQRCGTCLASLAHAQSPLQRTAGKLIAGLHAYTGLDLGPAARRAAGALASEDAHAPADPATATRMAAEMAERERAILERVLPLVHTFLAPSRFLLERFVEWGLPRERLLHLPTGLDLRTFGAAPRTPSERLRVAYLGTLAPHKGAHVLLEAWGRLEPDLRARGELVLHGPSQHHREYAAELERRARELGARVEGPLPREAVAPFLRGASVVVVPSLWYENAPLVVLESQALATPLLVSDIGGMAELVEPGVHGFHFTAGSAQDLARQLELLLREPGRLAGLYPRGPRVHAIGEDVARIEALYVEALAARAPRP